MANWDAVAVKAQLRLTAQRLGQLQEKQDSQGQITRKEIASLLDEGSDSNIALARAKAQHLIHEDSIGDILEALEMHIGLLVEHFNEIDQSGSRSTVVTEAASSIIHAAPHTESQDLHKVREILMQRLGPDFSTKAMLNEDNRVSSRVIRALTAPPPSATTLNDYMSDIAKSFGADWAPAPRRNDIKHILTDILDPATFPFVDLIRLRTLCSQGIPDDPPWIRPRVWKLFFGVLPTLKSSWDVDILKQRDDYYDLVRRLLTPMSNLPPPTTPLLPSDKTLWNVSNMLSRVPKSLYGGLQEEPETYPLSLLDASAPDDIKILCASNVDSRLLVLQKFHDHEEPNTGKTPEIRLDSRDAPEISLTTENVSGRPRVPTTLLSSKDYAISGAHDKHRSALLRLLYIHSCLHPLNRSPHIPSLLIPLYSVLLQETEPKDAAHVEADTFWVFQAMIAEFSELEDEEGGQVWMSKLSERLSWADEELSISLHSKGLDPALPHYSYQWLAPLLTQTLPLSAIYLVWDALFSCPPRQREQNAKLDHLVNICTSMLTRARAPLFLLGKPGRRSPGLWGDDNATRRPPSPLRPWELNDAFSEGVSLLQMYPVDAAGGIDRILQAASDMALRRDEEMNAPKAENLGIGARWTASVWKGFTNQLPSPDSDEEEEAIDHLNEEYYDDGNETETPQEGSSSGLTSRLTNSIWRGITNQSSMEAPPSPMTPVTPALSSMNSSPISHQMSLDMSPQPSPSPTSSSGPGVWGYAEKLRESDTAASLAKATSNWRAKAMFAWGSRKPNSSGTEALSPSSTTSELPSGSAAWTSWRHSPVSEPEDRRRGSLPSIDRSATYSPPPRPNFRPVRDSFMPPARGAPSAGYSSPGSPDRSPPSDGGFMHKAQASLASMAGLSHAAPVHNPVPKAGPRPLMLSSNRLMTAHAPSISRSATNTPSPHNMNGQWNDVARSGHAMHRESQSSISSLSPSDALGRTTWRGSRSDVESDGGKRASRLVPINRRSVSPMAPHFRMGQRPPSVDSSAATSPERGTRPAMAPRRTSDTHSEKGWGRVDLPDSPPISSPPVPQTPITVSSPDDPEVQVSNGDHQRLGSVVLSDSQEPPIEPPTPSRKLVRKKTPIPHHASQPSDASDSSIPPTPSLNPRLRTKKYPQRPSNLRIRANSKANAGGEKEHSPNTLSISPDGMEDHENTIITPKAGEFEVNEPSSASAASPSSPQALRKLSSGSQEPRLRKLSTDGPARVRKVSGEGRDARRKRESAADEGDDEGYDDLLSAYESEDPSKPASLR